VLEENAAGEAGSELGAVEGRGKSRRGLPSLKELHAKAVEHHKKLAEQHKARMGRASSSSSSVAGIGEAAAASAATTGGDSSRKGGKGLRLGRRRTCSTDVDGHLDELQQEISREQSEAAPAQDVSSHEGKKSTRKHKDAR
jgi:hypothetical protein